MFFLEFDPGSHGEIQFVKLVGYYIYAELLPVFPDQFVQRIDETLQARLVDSVIHQFVDDEDVARPVAYNPAHLEEAEQDCHVDPGTLAG